MRRLWITLIIALLLVAAPALALRSPAVVLALVHWAMGAFTELRLELKNPVIALYSGKISADELHLIPRGTAGPALLTVLNLEAQTRLGELLSARLDTATLSASQVLIYVSENDEASDPKPSTWMQLTTWLPARLDVGQVHLITASENTWIFPLKNLRGRRSEPDTFRATALADYEGEPLEAELEILGTHEDGVVQSVQLEAAFNAPESDSRVALEGVLEGDEERFHYDFTATASYRDIGEFLHGLDSSTALHGALELEARMVGDARSFTLSDASMTLDNMPDYGFEAAGELYYSRDDDSRVRLIAAGEMSNLEYLVNWLDLDITELGGAQASVSLSGTLEDPVIDNFVLITESAEGLAVNISGRLRSLNLNSLEEMSSAPDLNEIRVDARAPSIAVLERWTGETGFEPGPWRASWITRGSRETLQLNDIVLEAGTADTFKLRVEGSIDKIANAVDISLSSVEGVDLSVSASTQDSAHLTALVGRELPPFHRVEATLELAGSGELLALSDGQVQIDSSDLQAMISDISGSYRPAAEINPLRDARGYLDIAISDTGMLSQYTEREVPILGPATLTGELRQQAEHFQLAQLELAIDGEDLALATRGSIDDLQNLAGVRLQNTVTGLDIQRLLATLVEGLQHDGSLGELKGTFALHDRKEKWHIADLEISTSKTGGPVEFMGRGAIDDLTGFTTANLDAELVVRDTALLEALSGLRIQPVRARLSVKSRPEVLDISARADAGDTSVQADVNIGHDNNRITSLRAEVTTPHLHLADLGLQASEDPEENYAPAADIEADTRTQLEKLLENSPDYPTDVQISVEGITGENTSIDSLDIHVTGENDRYTLRRFSMGYDHAQAELRGIIDLNPSPPAVSLAGEALGFPLSTLSRDLGAPSDIRGRMTARGGISASGTDTTALTASLDGSVAIALEDTIIQGGAYDVLATDLLAWIYSGAVLETSTHLDCTMARFDIKKGVARTDSIYVQSERMIATGKGIFDLPGQKMDLTIIPRSRSRSFQIPSEVRLKGDFGDPRATISPIAAAADASAQALLLIPKLAMRLFGRNSGPSQEGIQPCQASLAN
jgi:hypothetical protein